MLHRLPFSGSFFLLLIICIAFFAATAAHADGSNDAAYDERGNFIYDRYGNCVRTRWMDETDPCAPPPPPEPAPVVKAPPPPPRPVIKLEQRTIYFDFDSAELTDQAVAKLNNLARVINNSRAIADVHVIGYADQIGSDSYNLALSKRRVAAVEEFLDRRSRMDTRAADIRGLGEAPDDGSCEDLARKERIECLRPQRRVEIEFKYQQR